MQELHSGDIDQAIAFAEQALDQAFGPQRAVWMERLVQEYPRMQAALNTLVQQGAVERGLQLAFLLQELWFEEQYTSTGRQWFSTLFALPQAGVSPTLRAQALDLAGALALNQSDYTQARVLKEQAVALLRETGDQARLGFVLIHLGYVFGHAQGEFATAKEHYQEALELLRGAGSREGTAHALAQLANVAIHTGDYAGARPLVYESLQIYRELNHTYDLGLSLLRAAGIAAGMGNAEQALRLAGASAYHRATIGVSLPAIFQARHEQMLTQARQMLDPTAQAVLWAEGQAMTLEAALAYALEVVR